MKAGNADGVSNFTEYYPTWKKPTAINSIRLDAGQSSAIFNLAGQKVSDSYRGIIVESGKKIFR